MHISKEREEFFEKDTHRSTWHKHIHHQIATLYPLKYV